MARRGHGRKAACRGPQRRGDQRPADAALGRVAGQHRQPSAAQCEPIVERAAQRAGLVGPRGDVPAFDLRNDGRQLFLLLPLGRDQLARDLAGRQGFVDQHAALQVARQPAGDHFQDVRCRRAEVARLAAVGPQRAQRHRGARHGHADVRGEAAFRHFPVRVQRRIVEHDGMAQQGLEIGQGPAQRPGAVDQPPLGQTPTGAQLELGGGRVEQVQSGGLAADRLGAGAEHAFEPLAGGQPLVVGAQGHRSAAGQFGFARRTARRAPTSSPHNCPMAPASELAPSRGMHGEARCFAAREKSLMCPGEAPTPGLTGADHIRFACACFVRSLSNSSRQPVARSKAWRTAARASSSSGSSGGVSLTASLTSLR